MLIDIHHVTHSISDPRKLNRDEIKLCRLKESGWNTRIVQGIGLSECAETLKNLSKVFTVKELHRVNEVCVFMYVCISDMCMFVSVITQN